MQSSSHNFFNARKVGLKINRGNEVYLYTFILQAKLFHFTALPLRLEFLALREAV
jgi:hypothetical protein